MERVAESCRISLVCTSSQKRHHRSVQDFFGEVHTGPAQVSFQKRMGCHKMDHQWTKLRRSGAGERFGAKAEAVASANGGS